MTKFIRLTTTAGYQILINTRYIQSVMGDADGNNCIVYIAGGVEQDDYYKTSCAMNEIQTMIEAPEAKEST